MYQLDHIAAKAVAQFRYGPILLPFWIYHSNGFRAVYQQICQFHVEPLI